MQPYDAPMQLLPAYKARLSADFLRFYRTHYNQRHRIYGHWSAGSYDAAFDDYHVNLLGRDGQRVVRTYDGNPFGVIKPHTYLRNSDAVGIGLACMLNATSSDYGPCPVTFEQLQALIQALRELCNNHRVPVGNFMTHAEAADNKDFPDPYHPDAPHDPYGPEATCERWDLWQYVNPRTGQIKTALRAPNGRTAPAPTGWLYLPDYIRGETVLLLQADTAKYWHPSHGRGL